MGPIRKRSDLGFIPDKPFLSRKHNNSNPIFHITTCPFIIIIIITTSIIPSSSAVDFLFNSFNSTSNVDTILGARIDPPVVRLTNDSDPLSMGRLFYPTRLRMKSNTTANTTTISSFSTSFIFSILPEIQSSPGFGIAFVLSNSEFPDGAIPGQRFGLFPTPTASRTIAPLLAIEFDTGLNPEFNDPDGNHVGIDLNSIVSTHNKTAEYYDLSSNESLPIDMRSGQNIHAWIEFDGAGPTINITLAPAGVSKPSRPLINFQDPEIANYISEEMYVGFSASKVTWVEVQRILAWSLSDTGQPARELNTSNLPVFLPPPSSSSLSTGFIAGVTCASVVAAAITVIGCYWYWRRKKREKENQEDVIEDWELEYWPHRFTYEELWTATEGFCKEQLLGFGGFGKVYRGVLVANNSNSIVAVKCVAHDSKQGVREFMAEISSMGRLQHKNLVQMRGWCRKRNELMLVYDYMPNGSLNKWIFDKPEQLLGWAGRRRVLADVAEGLLYLHHGWDQVVLHRDIKSSNVLLDTDMRGRLGDFGLAKLYQHGQVPSTTRVVGTLGYLAPELAHTAAPTAATDVYSFGVVMLEVASGRRPIETLSDDDLLLIDWVRDLYELGRVLDAADARIAGEYRADDMETVLKLGLACCHPDPEHRPTMKEVVEMLSAGEEARPPARCGFLITASVKGG